MKIEDCFEFGYITKTRGLKGELHVAITFDQSEKLKFKSIFIEINQKLVPYFVDSFKIPMPNIGYLVLEDIDHVDKAKLLTKKKIFLPNTLKPKRKKNEFLFTDLIGFQAEDLQAGDLGKILEVKEYPQQYLATVLYDEQEILIPLNEAFINHLDIPNQKILFDLPDGLLTL